MATHLPPVPSFLCDQYYYVDNPSREVGLYKRSDTRDIRCCLPMLTVDALYQDERDYFVATAARN